MKKKGFTLIELLAVIVILAIIALIAVPIVLNIINDTKNSATLRSADFYIDAVELSIAQAILDGGSIDGNYTVESNGNICKGEDCIEVEVQGDTPDSGSTIIITDGEISSVSLNYANKTVIKDNNELVFADSEANAGGQTIGIDDLISIIETAMVEKNVTDDRLDSCTLYVYNTKLFGSCYDNESDEKIPIKLNLNVQDEVSGRVSFYDSEVSSGNIYLNGEEFYKDYGVDSDYFISVTDEQRMDGVSKYIETINNAIAAEMEKDPSFVPTSYMPGYAISENGSKSLTLDFEEGTLIPSEQSFMGGANIRDGKLDLSSYEHEFYVSGKVVTHYPDGSMEVTSIPIEYNLGFDTTSYPTSGKQGSLFILDLTGKNIASESLSVISISDDAPYNGYIYENEVLYIPYLDLRIKITINE